MVDARASRGVDADDLLPARDSIHIILMLGGGARIAGAGGIAAIAAGEALLLGQPGRVTLRWQAPAMPLRLEIPRRAVQAQAFARFGEPRRIGRGNLLLRAGDAGKIFAALLCETGPGASRADIGAAIVAGLADVLRRQDRDGSLFPVSGSVKRALDRLAEPGAVPATPDEVLRAAGVLPATLRRNIAEITGVPLGRLIEHARLEWAHIRLASEREGRSLALLAAAVGYQPAAFTRAYQRHFGETPTQTRARAFAARG